MPKWEPIDSIAIPSTRAKSGKTFLWAGVGAAVVVFLGLAVLAFVIFLSPGRRPQLAGAEPEPEAESKDSIAPIVLRTNALTARQYRELGRQFRIRQWLEGYLQNGEHDPAWHADATNLITQWIEAAHGTTAKEDEAPARKELADRIDTNTVCRDPLVLLALASSPGDRETRTRRYERALELFPTSRHKAYPRFNATTVLASMFPTNSGRIAPLDAASLKHLGEMLADGSLKAEDQPILADILLTGWGSGLFNRNADRLCSVLYDAGSQFRWLALLMDGEREINVAWKERGSGFSDSVSPKGWQGFETHLGSARAKLQEAWQLHSEWPQAPVKMMSVALGSSGLEEMRLWFDRAIAAQMDSADAWHQMRWGLRPRWHGSLELMRDFGIEAVKTARFDTDIPGQFFQAVRDLETEQQLSPRQHIYGRDDIWPWMRKMYEGYIAEAQTEDDKFGWRTAFIMAAYLGGKYDVARKQLELTGWKLRPHNASGWMVDVSLLPLEVAARTGSLGADAAQAELAYTKTKLVDAAKLFKELSTMPGADERTIQFAKHRLSEVEQGRVLKEGGWLSLLPRTEDDLNWTAVAGTFKPLPSGGIEVRENSSGHLLYSRVRMRTNFEVKGEFEVLDPEPGRFQGGLVMGCPDLETTEWYSFRLCQNPDRGVASFAKGWSTREIFQPVKLLPGRNSFELKLGPGVISAAVNGQEVFRDTKIPRGLRVEGRDCFLGLCGWNGGTGKPAIRYYNLQVHALPDR